LGLLWISILIKVPLLVSLWYRRDLISHFIHSRLWLHLCSEIRLRFRHISIYRSMTADLSTLRFTIVTLASRIL
jgi:hypothetical protein